MLRELLRRHGMSSFVRSDRGLETVEYTVLTALIVAAGTFGAALLNLFQTIANVIG